MTTNTDQIEGPDERLTRKLRETMEQYERQRFEAWVTPEHLAPLASLFEETSGSTADKLTAVLRALNG